MKNLIIILLFLSACNVTQDKKQMETAPIDFSIMKFGVQRSIQKSFETKDFNGLKGYLFKTILISDANGKWFAMTDSAFVDMMNMFTNKYPINNLEVSKVKGIEDTYAVTLMTKMKNPDTNQIEDVPFIFIFYIKDGNIYSVHVE